MIQTLADYIPDVAWQRGLIVGFVVMNLLMAVGGLASWWERRFAARIQNRIGPNIVGPFGVLQPLADLLKMMQKEDIVPRNADRWLFNLAPALPTMLALGTAAVIPFGGTWVDGRFVNQFVVADLDVGILWVLALAGLMVFPIFMAGWASNNKYTLLSAMRAVAQGVSYEIPLVLAALVAVIATGELSIGGIVRWQAENGWLVVRLPVISWLAFLVFFAASLAEANRIPFDIPEAESELVGGIMVEYTGLKFGLFLFAEYVHTAIASLLAVTLFFGGADGPEVSTVGPLWLLLKAGVLFVIIYWIRWSWYRFRSDQLMQLCWRYLVPLTLGLVMLTAVVVAVGWV
ncbi:MAG: complex I subunit 1 family protein [Myxococcota bacterium]